MEHIAIMKKSWGLVPKILDGRKIIESRWLLNRSSPWDKVKRGDTVFFKNVGEPVTAKALVSDVLQFEDLTPKRVHEILDWYGEDDGLAPEEIAHYEALFRDKNFCVLIFLEDAQEITPFNIDKEGYGAMSAWISVPSVAKLRVS